MWTPEATQAFALIKRKLTTAPILVLLDFSIIFELHSDALKVSIGVVLSQQGQLVDYFSEKLSDDQSRYNTYDVEFYAVVKPSNISDIISSIASLSYTLIMMH